MAYQYHPVSRSDSDVTCWLPALGLHRDPWYLVMQNSEGVRVWSASLEARSDNTDFPAAASNHRALSRYTSYVSRLHIMQQEANQEMDRYKKSKAKPDGLAPRSHRHELPDLFDCLSRLWRDSWNRFANHRLSRRHFAHSNYLTRPRVRVLTSRAPEHNRLRRRSRPQHRVRPASRCFKIPRKRLRG